LLLKDSLFFLISIRENYTQKIYILLGAGVKGVAGRCRGSLPSQTENWLVRQLSDESKPVYQVGFIREKGKATAREAQRSPEAGRSLLR
jgi:hypothetical protein